MITACPSFGLVIGYTLWNKAETAYIAKVPVWVEQMAFVAVYFGEIETTRTFSPKLVSEIPQQVYKYSTASDKKAVFFSGLLL